MTRHSTRRWALAALTSVLALALATAVLAGPPTSPDSPKPDVLGLLDEPSVKVVRITLAPHATLAEHTTPVHATVAAMAGKGDVLIAGKRTALNPHTAVFLPKAIPHAVVNTGDTPLVLLVHHLKTTR